MSNDSGSQITPLPSFQQQGQLDWVALGDSICSVSLGILKRLTDAGIQPLTYQAGLAISTKFCLSEDGSQRVREALSKLKPFHGFESILWFGFGQKSFLAFLTERELGVNCAALCACLGETYGSAGASRVLQTLWKVNEFPSDMEPSRTQFATLVSNCAGLFIKTHFCEIMQRMAGPYKRDNPHVDPERRGASSGIAKAIDGLFQVSRGALKAIEIHGCIDIAFIGTIAYWLFDLSVWIEMHDGSCLFSSCLHSEEAAVRLHYTTTKVKNPMIQISATTFVVESVQDLLSDDLHAAIIFRVSWDKCLAELFNDELRGILSQTALLGNVLGAIARIYKALALCEQDVAKLSRIHFINYQPQGYGASYINGLCALLPELSYSRTFLEGASRSLNQSVAKNITTINDSMAKLRARCRCRLCGTAKSHSSRGESSCYMAVLLLLRHLGDMMAHVDADSTVAPRLSGLQAAYNQQADLWDSARDSAPYFNVAMGFPRSGGTSTEAAYTSSRLKSTHLDYIMSQIYLIFVGLGYRSQAGENLSFRKKPHCTAVSRLGVCIWLDALRSLNTDPASMSTFHVMVGRISYKNRSYTSVWDLSPPYDTPSAKMPSAVFNPSRNLKNPSAHESQVHMKVQALATERDVEGSIGFAYQVQDSRIPRLLQPGILTEMLLAWTATFPCPKTLTCSDGPIGDYYERISGWDFMGEDAKGEEEKTRFTDEGAFYTWTASEQIGKLLAIEGSRQSDFQLTGTPKALSVTVLCSGQCVGCLLRYWKQSKDTMIWEASNYMRGKYANIDNISYRPCRIHII